MWVSKSQFSPAALWVPGMEFRLPASVVSKHLCPQVSFPIPYFAFLRRSFTVWPRLALSSQDCCLGLSAPWLQLCTIVFPWEWMGHRHRLQLYKWQWGWQWWVAIRRSGHRSLCVCMCVYLSVCLSSTHTHTHTHTYTAPQWGRSEPSNSACYSLGVNPSRSSLQMRPEVPDTQVQHQERHSVTPDSRLAKTGTIRDWSINLLNLG